MRAFTCLLLCLACRVCVADMPVPLPGCIAPERPGEDVPEAVWQRFLADVDAYRACISSYVESNNAASDAHRTAANRATLAWNEFVRTSLNAPEDYPWPPESDQDLQ